MNFLIKWGKKLLITGIISLALDLILRMTGLDFFSDLGGTYINLAMIALGSAGLYIDKSLNVEIKTDNKKLDLLIAQAIAEEKQAKKIEQWEDNIIFDFVKQTLENNKFSIWIKNKKITIEDYEILLRINFSDKNELVSSTQEIILKDGKKYQQNKHELAIKKEYSEKIFICSCNIIEEFFEKIIKLEKVSIKTFLPDSNDLILDIFANREMFNKLKISRTQNSLDKLKFFEIRYDFDSKNFDFKVLEI